MLLPVLPVLLETLADHFRHRQFIGAFLSALLALDAVFSRFHRPRTQLHDHFGREAFCLGLEEKDLPYGHPFGTGQAVSAAVAKIVAQFGSDALYLIPILIC